MSTGGLSAARLGLMHRVMEGYVERGELPGLVTLVSRRGETHVDAVGTMAVGGTVPMGRDTVFRISSMTKPITAVATMILGEPVSTPLLRAMGGRRLGQGPPAPQEPPGPDEWMRNLGTLPLMHHPGERWMYNTGSDVLGVLVARASDRPFETFLRERVFGPLGMVDTGFATPAGVIGRLATAYGTDPSTGALDLYDEPATGQWSVAPAFPSGGAGLVSTVDDYLAFGRMLLDGGRQRGGRILSRPSVATMTTDHLTPEQKAVSGIVPGFFDGHGWGFGVSVVTRRDVVPGSIGTFGWDGGLGTSWFTDPAEELVVVLMTQCAWPSPSPPAVMRDFWALTYAAIDD